MPKQNHGENLNLMNIVKFRNFVRKHELTELSKKLLIYVKDVRICLTS